MTPNIKMSSNSEYSVYDYLEMAEDAHSKKQTLEYLEKALEIEPDNVDALMMKSDLTLKDPLSHIKELEKIAEKERMKLEKQNFFKDCMGDFWGFTETRPYMRVRYELIKCYMDLGMMRLAEQHCVDMLKLCENDNLGLRYTLMHIYAYFEDEDALLKLYEKFPEDNAMTLLPLSVLYYKRLDLTTAAGYLEKLKKNNKDLKDFINALNNDELDDVLDEIIPYGYQPGTAEELVTEVEENHFLFIQTPGYFDWANRELKRKKQGSKKK